MQANPFDFQTSSPSGLRQSRLGWTLALPFLLLGLAALISWPWRRLDLPSAMADLSPVSIVLLSLTVLAGFHAVGRRLPQGLLSWPPAGMGAMAILGMAALAQATDRSIGDAGAGPFLATFLLALAFGAAAAKHGTRYGIAFFILYVMAVEVRASFHVFEVEATEPISGAFFLTLASALRTALEVVVLLWLTRRLVLAPGNSGVGAVWGMLALLVAHGPLTSWEFPLLNGDSLTVESVGQPTLDWLISISLLLGLVTLSSRVRFWLVQETEAINARRAAAQAAAPATTPAPAPVEVAPLSDPELREQEEEAPAGQPDQPPVEAAPPSAPAPQERAEEAPPEEPVEPSDQEPQPDLRTLGRHPRQARSGRTHFRPRWRRR